MTHAVLALLLAKPANIVLRALFLGMSFGKRTLLLTKLQEREKKSNLIGVSGCCTDYSAFFFGYRFI